MSYYNLSGPSVVLPGMIRQQLATYDNVRSVLVAQAAKIYADPATAAAYVAAMGTGAVTQFTASAATLAWLNQLAPLVGRPTLPSLMPAGYTFTPNADGSAVLSYTPPAPSNNSSGTTTGATTNG